jgi:hypothetical protein
VRVRLPSKLSLLAPILAAIMAATAPARAETIVVGPEDGSCPNAIFSRIQSAIDIAVPGSTIVVCPGVYAEQLLVTKRVRLFGSPGTRLVPAALQVRTTSLRSGRAVVAAVIVKGSATIDGLAIDASAHGVTTCDGSEPLVAGVYVRGVPASVSGTSITGTRIPGAPPACANGVGILVHGGGGSPRIRIEGNSIEAYQRAGIVVQDSGVRAFVRENFVRGDGDTAERVQNGIEIANGAAGRIEDNVVIDNAGASGPSCDLDAGIVLDAPRLRVRGNQLDDNTVGIRAGSRGHTIRDNVVAGGAGGLIGLDLAADESRVSNNTFMTLATAAIRVGGNRSRLRGNAVSSVHAGPACDDAKNRPGCAAVLTRCGTAVWLLGQANQVLATLISDVDLSVADDGVANSVR